MLQTIDINHRKIGSGYPPYVIAEISGNHNGDIKRAKKLIKKAKDAGVCAVKLQTYTPDSLTINSNRDDFLLKDGTWKGRNLYDLYTEAHTPWDWFPELFAYAKKEGVTIFSSPFDKEAVNFLQELDTPAYKIASNELMDWLLVEAVVSTGKPMIVSTGTASKQDILETVEFIRQLGGDQLAVLHCVSAYPALPEDTNLATMLNIRDSFDVICGLSDHTLGTATAITAVAMGACIIEKHYTLDRNDGGPDSSFSLEPDELKLLCHDVKWAWDSMHGVKYGIDRDLKKKGIFTRQFWSIKDINIGDKITAENIKSIRAPADAGGISTKYYRDIFGSKAKVFIPKHSAITFDSLTAC